MFVADRGTVDGDKSCDRICLGEDFCKYNGRFVVFFLFYIQIDDQISQGGRYVLPGFFRRFVCRLIHLPAGLLESPDIPIHDEGYTVAGFPICCKDGIGCPVGSDSGVQQYGIRYLGYLGETRNQSGVRKTAEFLDKIDRTDRDQ